MQGLRKHTYAYMRPRVSGASIFAPPDGAEGEGETGRCGHWDAEYDARGYCRDATCKAARLTQALQSGDAWRMPDGTIMWYVK